MTMVARLAGGRGACIYPAVKVFENTNRNYLIRGVPYISPDASFWTGQKLGMDLFVVPQWLSERCALAPLPNRRKRVLYVDNCGGQKVSNEV